ncbi:MAG: DUF5654 family protein [Chloroflexota bacterium]|nr:DUF5654 family protein [Chloroflexota bacterium]PLS78080.1 MAG: hypothetical protein CYG59_20450 [Chloroflexota bacterium]
MNAPRFLQIITTLASASLGLVAALAWNDAIKATIVASLGADGSLTAMYAYSILATVPAATTLS